MPRVVFTANLQRHVACPECTVAGATLRAALHEVFAGRPQLRDYLLDEQGHLRKHIFVFIDGRRVHDRERLAEALDESSEVYVMQALTGG